MKVITAPEQYKKQEGDILLFLAGGISNCPDWQKEVISVLEKVDPSDLVVFNPRRENFPIHDPNAAKEQISWEFKYLNMADIFTMYFCSGESDQPICMYELGRHLHRISKDNGWDNIIDHVVVSVEDGYKRKNDVIIQTSLALERPEEFVSTRATPFRHAEDIILSYLCLKFGGTARFSYKIKEYKYKMRLPCL